MHLISEFCPSACISAGQYRTVTVLLQKRVTSALLGHTRLQTCLTIMGNSYHSYSSYGDLDRVNILGPDLPILPYFRAISRSPVTRRVTKISHISVVSTNEILINQHVICN